MIAELKDMVSERESLVKKLVVGPPEGVWGGVISGGVTSTRINRCLTSIKHVNLPLQGQYQVMPLEGVITFTMTSH